MNYVSREDARTLARLVVPGDELQVYTPRGQGVSLRNWYAGKHCFLLCGGPSLSLIDPGVFDRRGLMTMGMNNSWTLIRPRLWIGCDHPGRFIDVGWKDAGITKFVPLQQAGYRLRVKEANHFRDSAYLPTQMPAVWFFHRNTNYHPDTFLEQMTVCWGRDKELNPESCGNSTMLGALRLLHWLGFSDVYLCGCDFRMEKGAHNKHYAWDQGRRDRAVENNQRMYAFLNDILPELKEKFRSRPAAAKASASLPRRVRPESSAAKSRHFACDRERRQAARGRDRWAWGRRLCHGRILCRDRKAPLARHLTDCVGETDGAGRGGVSTPVPQLWWRHSADRVHHGARGDSEDPDPSWRTPRTSARLAGPWPADRLGRARAGP